MASSNFTANDVRNAAFYKEWNELEGMIRAQPELINERYYSVTSLYWIAYCGAPQDIVTNCLQVATKETVDYVDPGGDCILHWFSRHGYSQALRIALKTSRRNVNQQDAKGETPLHYLLERNHSYQVHIDGTQALHDGADLSLTNEKHKTPADVYMQNECKKYDAASKAEQKNYLMKILHTGIVPVEILARGADALKAFNEALSEGKTEVNEGRTIFAGLERVGKTSTINSFLKNPFNPHQDITDAIANTMVCTHDLHDELNWMETHDQSNIFEEKMVDLITSQLLEKQIEEKEEVTQNVLPSDAKEDETEYRQGQSSSEASRDPEVQPEIKKRRTNTQTQTIEEVPENIASKVQKRMNSIKFTRGATSDWQKSGNAFIMNIWDFGGQPIYHVIQRIYMVSFAVVCIVFNLEDDLDAPANVRDPTTGETYEHRMTNLQFILYWIRSVYANSRDSELDDRQLSPSVIVIGTHLGSIEGNEEEKTKKAEEIFSKIQQAIEGKPYESMVFQTFFAIENSLPFSSSNASNIMNQILKFAKKMVRNLPLKWLLVQQEIQKLKERIYLPTKEVIALVDSCGVKQDVQRVLLEYLHDIGEILYFPDDEALKDIIVLDLMRIVDMFKTIITVVDPQLVEPALRGAWKKLDSGILEERLLRHLWKRFNFSDETFDFFVSLMQKFGLVCEKKMTTDGERLFYVLSRLKPERVQTSPINYGKRAISIFHDFGGYLPDDLFQRGVTKFIERFQVKDNEPKLSYEHVELSIDEDHHVVLSVVSIKHRRMFKTTIINSNQLTKEDEPSATVCKKVLNFLEIELKIFCKSGARGVEVTRYIRCICNNAHMHIVRKFDKAVLPCGSDGMEVTRYLRIFGDVQQQGALSQSHSAITKPEGYVDDAIIATVSEEMNLSWRRFGVRLGLTWSKVNSCGDDEALTHKAVENMLKCWRSNIGSEHHQLKVLCTALKEHGRMDLVVKTFEWEFDDEIKLITGQAGEGFGDQDLLYICDNLEPDSWRRLGVRLGLKWTDINKVANNNKRIEDCIMELLVTWRERQSTNQMAIMINALEQQELVELAEYVCERHGYKDELEAATTRMNIYHATHHVEGHMGDIDLLFVAESLGEDWKAFGRHIGLKHQEIKRIEMNFPPPPIEDAIMEMLVKWRQKQNAKVNHLKTMIAALDAIERTDTKEELQTYYQENYHQEDQYK